MSKKKKKRRRKKRRRSGGVRKEGARIFVRGGREGRSEWGNEGGRKEGLGERERNRDEGS